METPELPEGYFFRVNKGRIEDWGLSHYNATVQLMRKRPLWWPKEVGVLAISNTSDSHPTQKELFNTMAELKSWWENKKVEVLPYGDYPPKTLKDMDCT